MALGFLIKYLVVFLVAALTTYALTPVVMRLAVRAGLLDVPDSRRIHKRTVPRGGGIAVYIGFHTACALIFLYPWSVDLQGSLTAGWWFDCFVTSTLLLVLGVVDDAHGMRWSTKLAGQVAVACTMFFLGHSVGQIQQVPLSVPLDCLLTVFWFLAFINAFNLIDGMDGLASGLACIAAGGLLGVSLLRHAPTDSLTAIALVGCCFAFLRYNFHPARIFLGDSGSMFLGYTIAAVALSSSTKGTLLASVGVPFLAIGVPAFDTFLAVWRRSIKRVIYQSTTRVGIMQADMDHLHHRLLRMGLTQRSVAMCLYGANLLLVGVGILSLTYNSHVVGIFLLAFVVGSYVVVRHIATTELWDSGFMIASGLRRPASPLLSAILYPALDFLLLMASLAGALTLTAHETDGLKRAWLDSIAVWCGIPFMSLFFAGVYSQVWSRARITDYVTVAAAITGGSLLCLAFISLAEPELVREEVLLWALFLSLSIGSLITLRIFPRFLEDALIAARQTEKAAVRVLLYGAGDTCLSYLRLQRAALCGQQIEVVGLIDDDPHLRRRTVYGRKVLGSGMELARIVHEHDVREIIVAAPLSEPTLANVQKFAAKQGITLRRWQVGLDTLSEQTFPAHSPAAPSVPQRSR